MNWTMGMIHSLCCHFLQHFLPFFHRDVPRHQLIVKIEILRSDFPRLQLLIEELELLKSEPFDLWHLSPCQPQGLSHWFCWIFLHLLSAPGCSFAGCSWDSRSIPCLLLSLLCEIDEQLQKKWFVNTKMLPGEQVQQKALLSVEYSSV